MKKSLKDDIKISPIILRLNNPITIKTCSTNNMNPFLQKIHNFFQKLDSLNNEYISRR